MPYSFLLLLVWKVVNLSKSTFLKPCCCWKKRFDSCRWRKKSFVYQKRSRLFAPLKLSISAFWESHLCTLVNLTIWLSNKRLSSTFLLKVIILKLIFAVDKWESFDQCAAKAFFYKEKNRLDRIITNGLLTFISLFCQLKIKINNLSQIVFHIFCRKNVEKETFEASLWLRWTSKWWSSWLKNHKKICWEDSPLFPSGLQSNQKMQKRVEEIIWVTNQCQ